MAKDGNSPSWTERIVIGFYGGHGELFYVKVGTVRRRFRVEGHGVVAIADTVTDARTLWRTRFKAKRARDARQAEMARKREGGTHIP